MVGQGRSLDPHKKRKTNVVGIRVQVSHSDEVQRGLQQSKQSTRRSRLKRFCHIDFGKSFSPLGTVHKEQGNLQLWHKKFLTSSRDVGTISQWRGLIGSSQCCRVQAGSRHTGHVLQAAEVHAGGVQQSKQSTRRSRAKR